MYDDYSFIIELGGILFAMYGSFVITRYKQNTFEDRMNKVEENVKIANDFNTSNIRRLEHYDKIEDEVIAKLQAFSTEITTLKESANQSITLKDVKEQFAHISEYQAQKECMNADIQKLERKFNRLEDMLYELIRSKGC